MYDEDIREILLDYFDCCGRKIRVFEEKIMGKSRADLILVTEEGLVGIEIKSDADTYERLKRQVRDYDRFCDRNYIAVGKSHEKHVTEHIPGHWGIYCVSMKDGEPVIELKKEATEHKKCQVKEQIRWMWRMELNQLLEWNHLPKYRQKSKRFVREKLMERVEESLLKKQMRELLFERDYSLWEDDEE